MKLIERLAKDLNARGLRAFVGPGGLVVDGEVFTLKEAAWIALVYYGNPRIEFVPPDDREPIPWEPNELLGPLLDWAETHEFHPKEEKILNSLVSGKVDPVEAASWAWINGFREFADALSELAERWLEANGA